MAKYAVIENAGYERENLRQTFEDYHDAQKWMEHHYTEQERTDLHVEIAVWDEKELFWTYDYCVSVPGRN